MKPSPHRAQSFACEKDEHEKCTGVFLVHEEWQERCECDCGHKVAEINEVDSLCEEK